MSRVDTGAIRTEPYASRPTCANGHPWTHTSTRWRRRGYRGKHTASVERDCLTCKQVSEGERRKRRISGRAYR